MGRNLGNFIVFDFTIKDGQSYQDQSYSLLVKYNISYTFKVTSANSISIVIWEKDFSKKLIVELRQKFNMVTVEKVAMVCLLGSNIDQPGLLAKSSAALAENNINIKSAGIALRKVNIQFLIDRQHFATAIIALNQAMR